MKRTVLLPIRTVSESNTYGHWRVKARRVKEHRRTTQLFLSSTIGVFDGLDSNAIVELVRVSPRALDDDNLRGALKATRDGIADWFGIDDRDPRVEWKYAQRRGAKGQYAVEISIEVMG